MSDPAPTSSSASTGTGTPSSAIPNPLAKLHASLPVRPAFALPARPSIPVPARRSSSSPRRARGHSRSRSPSHSRSRSRSRSASRGREDLPTFRREDDFYRPRGSESPGARKGDTYIADGAYEYGRDRRERERDVYIPGRGRGRSRDSRSRSRSRSVSRDRRSYARASDRDQSYSYRDRSRDRKGDSYSVRDSRDRSPSYTRSYSYNRATSPIRGSRSTRSDSRSVSPQKSSFTTLAKKRELDQGLDRYRRAQSPDSATEGESERQERLARRKRYEAEQAERDSRDSKRRRSNGHGGGGRYESDFAAARGEDVNGFQAFAASSARQKRESRDERRERQAAKRAQEAEELQKVYAEERARKQKLLELKEKRIAEERAAALAQRGSLASRIGTTQALSGPRVPTGPRSTPLSIPTGPRGAPTGPRSSAAPTHSYTSTATHTAPAAETNTGFTQTTSTNEQEEDMPSRGRGRGRGGSTPRSTGSKGPGGGGSRPRGANGTANGAGRAVIAELEGPIWDQTNIEATYGGRTNELKAVWAENPKAPLANHPGSGTGVNDDGGAGKGFQVVEGMIAGQKLFRAEVIGDDARGIIGIGDNKNRKEAEKLAALSAVYQLQAAGLLDGRKGAAASSSATTSVLAPAAGGSDTAKLSDGTEITYDRARQFMEYYCKRYSFGKPDIDYSQSTQRVTKPGKKGKSASTSKWEAVMTVGGRKIGMGSAGTKKAAQIKCYLDVTQYLESCDPDLWRDFCEFSLKDPSANIGLAPHLFFQMSDELNDDVQGLCGDLRGSNLVKNAPTSGATQDQAMPSWSGNRFGNASDDELQRKSDDLLDRLTDYASDPLLAKMRQQREALPVTSRATDILAKIEVNDVTIVMAATGSGKTTQIPQLIFDDYIKRGQGARCNVVCTQPRRLAAMSVAERIADERGQSLGGEVGYQVRFDAKPPQPNGSITFCTTGIFLKRMQSALGTEGSSEAVKVMDEVTHIIVDEVHERDVDTDLSLVVLKRLLADRKKRNKPIKIVLMSATIDATLFQRYFTDSHGRLAPVAEVPGRTFPVAKHYLDDIVPEIRGKLANGQGGWVFQDKDVNKYLESELSPNKAAFTSKTGMELAIPYPLVALVIAYVLKQSDDGHVLVFLPGWDEIKKVANILLSPSSGLLGVPFTDSSRFSVHYLHSTIPAAEQKEVFRPPPKGVRRIILATNIAETSVTIPDVVYVVDTGRVKEKRYDPERHMSSLVSAWVGSSNLNQRAGRAGRHREGEYFGLVSKNRLNGLDTHQLVEMKRSDLSNVVMHVKALNLGEVEDVLAATIEPPEPARIVAAMQLLRMLGALDSYKNLTALGRVLLQLPVEAAIGKLCLYGSFFRCLDSALTLAAVLTNRDPFLAPIEKKAEADAIKDSWTPSSFRSDPLAVVAAYNRWSEMDDRGQYGMANAFCSDNFLSKPSLLQIKQVKNSLAVSLDQAGVIAVSAGGSVGRIGRRGYIPKELNEHGNSLPMLAALIALGQAPNFALRTGEKTCRTAQDKVTMIHNSSVNAKKREANSDEAAPFDPAEKRLYAFGEKARNVSNINSSNAVTHLRNVTRLDIMTYMLFGAYELVVTRRGLECDGWLPITGNLHALDDVQRLKGFLEAAFLRVMEGLGKSLTKGRDERWVKRKSVVDVHKDGSSRIREDEDVEGDDEVGEMESDDEDGPAKPAGAAPKRVVEALSHVEIQELEMLTTDVVRILDAYAAEREVQASRFQSRAGTPGPGPQGMSGGPGRRY